MDYFKWLEVATKMMKCIRNDDNDPCVSLHDSFVREIDIRSRDVLIKFDDDGFWVKNENSGEFNRAKIAEMELYDCYLENVSIFILKRIKLFGIKLFGSKYVYIKKWIDTSEFFQKINSSIWKFEFISEYIHRGGGRALYIGSVSYTNTKKRSEECYIEIDYKDKEYRYSE